jgi:hypothetical protein
VPTRHLWSPAWIQTLPISSLDLSQSNGKTTKRECVEDKEITAGLDQLVAVLRLEQEFRLAAVLHHHVHRVAWSNHSELFRELSRLLRNAQASQVSSYSPATSAQIDKLLSDIDSLV